MRKIFQLPVINFPLDMSLNTFLRSFREAVDSGGRQLESKEILDGVLIENINIPATTNTNIEHTLGRIPRGWKVVDVDAAATIHRIDWDTLHLTLYASVEVNVNLWVF